MRILSLFLAFFFLFQTVAVFADDKASDDMIYDQVRRKLANDPDVKGGTLEVEVKDGTVTIKGSVENDKLKSKAERITKKVKGVKGVVNQLVIKPRGA
ncbi:BON domain-containing protein [uncultured Paludibaculum sp.]|uniref:BON domain-containing protein n=1 Tax=uncultured Paludibaculum sp. TaxID=1765020 RepID=UPI002AAC102C|nr:BON domain-containing protein [uncultured Paludibaculum sp.]